MKQEILVEAYKDCQYKDMVDLLVYSFEKKFTHLQSLPRERIAEFMADIWDIRAQDSSCVHLVARDKEVVTGVILVRLWDSKSSQAQVPLLTLCRRYGVYNTLLLYWKMMILEQNVFERREGYIEHVAVHPDYRGRGIGASLLQRAEQELVMRGYTACRLAAAQNNPAVLLYRRLGYKVTDKKRSHLKGGLVGEKNWFIMRKNLRRPTQPFSE